MEDSAALDGNMLAVIVAELAKHTLTLWVTWAPMEINTINGGDSSPEVQLLFDSKEKNGSMVP